MPAVATARPLRRFAGVTVDAAGDVLRKAVDYAASSGGHVDERQHDADDAGDR